MLDIASPLGGDVEKIGNFQSGKSRSHGTIFLYHLLGAMMRKLTIFIAGKYARIVPSFWHLLLGVMLRKLAIVKRGKYIHMVSFFGITSWGRFWENWRTNKALCSATQIIDLRRIRLLLLYIKVRTAWGVTGDTVSKNQRFVALRVLDDGISPAGDGPRD